jgi:hypothetical protein
VPLYVSLPAPIKAAGEFGREREENIETLVPILTALGFKGQG